jgi:predicted signal transduction protein with EAL and GGDEF domain
MHESHKLQGIGCDTGQGYLFAKPMPKADFLGALGRRMIGGPRPAAAPLSASVKLLRGLFAES